MHENSSSLLCITVNLITLSLLYSPPSLGCVTRISRKPGHDLQRSVSYYGRNVCPSWHHNAVYQLTRGVGGVRGGRERGCWDVRSSLGVEGEKKKALCGCLSDRKWSNSMTLAFGKIASFKGHSLEEASLTWGHICLRNWLVEERKKQWGSGGEVSQRVF